MTTINGRIARLEAEFESEGDVGRERRAIPARAAAAVADCERIRAECLGRGEGVPVVRRCADGTRYLVAAGCPGPPTTRPSIAR
jgi:hypothetical protein